MARAKSRSSMIDEFPTKTEDFLDFVGGNFSNVLIEKSKTEWTDESQAADRSLPLSAISLPNQQPRRYFSEQAMDSLIKSIEEHGILQPLMVRILKKDNSFELVAGERRYRAAQTLGLSEVPVVIRDLSDQQAIQITLLENLQREDLNPIEETEGILQLLCMNLEASKEEVISLLNQIAHIKKQGGELTNNVIRKQWEQVSEVFNIIGRLTPDSFRSNRLPLLNLPEDVLEALREGALEYTKARAISRLKDKAQRQELLGRVVEENWSVRNIQEYVNELKPHNGHDELVLRIKATYHKVKQNRQNLELKQRQSLEKLLAQIEKILD
jgi:ParB family transcriptional regulator, chromosome partitioning protein